MVAAETEVATAVRKPAGDGIRRAPRAPPSLVFDAQLAQLARDGVAAYAQARGRFHTAATAGIQCALQQDFLELARQRRHDRWLAAFQSVLRIAQQRILPVARRSFIHGRGSLQHGAHARHRRRGARKRRRRTWLLLVLLLEKAFVLSQHRKLFAWFMGTYNAGVLLTAGMQLTHGIMTVLGIESSKMVSGIAGLGHMSITAGMILLFIMLRRSVGAGDQQKAPRKRAVEG